MAGIDWRSIFDSMPQAAAVLDADRNVLAGNKKMGELIGMALPGYREKKCWEVFHGKLAEYSPAECPYERMKQTRNSATGEVHLERAGAQCVAVCSPMFAADGKLDYVIHTFTDITARERAEAELRKSEKKYRQLFQSIMDAIVLVDSDGMIIYANSPFQKILGYSIVDLINMNHRDLTPPRWNELEDGVISQQILERGYSDTYEKEYRRKDGSLCPVEVRVFLLRDENDRPQGTWAIVRDISGRKMADETIKLLLEEKENILKEVHHRIKNNMTTMMSLLSLQSASAKSPAPRKVLTDAENRLRSMGVLYDKLYRSDNFREMSVDNYLPALVDEIVAAMGDSRGVRVHTQADPFVLGVKELSSLGIIVNELLSNALKYAFVGRAEGSITVTASRLGARSVVAVCDDGVGIPESIDIERGEGTRVVLEF